MIIRFITFSLLFLPLTISAIKHPTGFTTVQECVQNGAQATYLLEEASGTQQFVLTLENGIVVGEGAIVTADGKILADTETYKCDEQQLMQDGRDISKENSIYFNGTLAVISSPGQQCYYHWLLQVLPRLKILSESKLAYDKIYLYPDNFKYHWQKDSLFTVMDYLGIPRDKLIFIEDEPIVVAKKLLVPSVPWNPSKNRKFWDLGLNWYKKFFKDVFVAQTKITPKNIFISRSKARYRRITNESALMELLSKKGFVSYCLEELSLCEQITLFNNAEVIVGPHGAGWTNLIFCNPGTTIIEIDHGLKGDVQRSLYKEMAPHMDCSYYPFYTDLLEPTDCSEIVDDPVNQDMSVDIAAFEQFLEKVANVI